MKRFTDVIIGIILGALIVMLGFWMTGCSDDKEIRTILREVLPAKPPIECPPKQCRHGQECVPCEDEKR